MRHIVLRMIILWLVSTQATYATESKIKYELLVEILDDGKLRTLSESGLLKKIPPGSLLKPFLAIYLQNNNALNNSQKVFCPGSRKPAFGMRKACWAHPGHGWVNAERALAESCNHYFYSISQGIEHSSYFTWLHEEWGFPANLYGNRQASSLIGDNLNQEIKVDNMVAAYNKLFSRLNNPKKISPIVQNGLLATGYGTLKAFSEKLRKYPEYRFLAGKTGSSIKQGEAIGAAIALVMHEPSGRKFIVFAVAKKKMGSSVAADNLFSIFSHETKNRKIP